ncbi:MAG TPA: nitrile hydratase subunit beta [Amaricoccus sp.]|nr:nitrile hydratase subunit beta [Amaricoccus sp.]
MNGPQDLGGQAGFGPVAPETDEPVFHAPWEARALGLTLAAGALGRWTIDESRHTRESLHPADYYASSYYEIWTRALEALLLRHGLVSRDELRSGHAGGNSEGDAVREGDPRVLRAAGVPGMLARRAPYAREIAQAPAFAPGDQVRTAVMHPLGHTRLPRYARGKLGTVERVNGAHVFPDSNAHGRGEAPQWLYTVVFDAAELWGRDADPRQRVSIDAWESYLEPA